MMNATVFRTAGSAPVTVTPLQTLPGLVLPADTPDYAREYMAELDAAVTRAAAIVAPSADSYRRSAEAFRKAGNPFSASEAEEMADMLELDPRLYVAGRMYWAGDGAAKVYIHTYLRLLRPQAEARRAGLPLPSQSWTQEDWVPGRAA